MRKEICVHKLLKHRNIVGCYGSRQEGRRQYIFLEYCEGGELFDKITPDVGMGEYKAQGYFVMLMAGLEYLHKKGVSHRDIKPENLLLTENDVLKISDFGMATVFRHQGRERLLERRCGTMPYIAPEILVRSQYNAEPADIWSCGVVLVAMLTGELPWDKPTADQVEYNNWKDLKYALNPWKKIDNLPLSLLRKVLMPLPSKRYTLGQIQNHVWMKKKFREGEENVLARPSSSGQGFKRLCSGVELGKEQGAVEDPLDRDYSSQPLPTRQDSGIRTSTLHLSPCTFTSTLHLHPCTSTLHIHSGPGGEQEAEEVFQGFTQPAKMEDMMMSSQVSSSRLPRHPCSPPGSLRHPVRPDAAPAAGAPAHQVLGDHRQEDHREAAHLLPRGGGLHHQGEVACEVEGDRLAGDHPWDRDGDHHGPARRPPRVQGHPHRDGQEAAAGVPALARRRHRVQAAVSADQEEDGAADPEGAAAGLEPPPAPRRQGRRPPRPHQLPVAALWLYSTGTGSGSH